MVNPIIEVCANSAASCVTAEQGGAARVELCAGIPEGGTTPSYGEMVTARRAIGIQMNVIIRPRGGDFLYTPAEMQAMLLDIEAAKAAGADGVVFGCLRADGTIDIERNRQLKEAAGNLSTTFHRAFDVCRDPFTALEEIIALGFDRILTSGQEASAPQGTALLAELVRRADGRIIIMPGCGVNEHNVAELARATGAQEFHMSARHRVESGMVYRNERVSMGGTVTVEEFARDLTDPQRVAQSIEALRHV
ncbi:MAG TPA: copper homeostasis protein CutC [Candidatus Rikenella faecigallinarum]|uniref:PF03932 family protein CutC n=1 Tax=Candidatus Rikenella faecigallinarum TaxID=2838745 RepID=A0A9D1QD49_9BACT|nr:copper homeostasis protein CutC [Candidatus Rikenella faecigallinarum]